MLVVPPTTDSSRLGTTHVVQFFDAKESLADAVAGFFGEGLLRNETMLAVMDEEGWYAVAMRLAANGLPVDEALRLGHITVRSAGETLNVFMRHGTPNPHLFAASVGPLVSDLAEAGRPLRIYGEMVDVLAAEGEYDAAHELEALWNELGTEAEFKLFCGYRAAHFGDPRNADALRRICASHSEVLSNPRDVLGSFLVRSHTAAS
jgi:hypothetical protein